MKRLIATLSFAALATAALAENGKPFEQLDLDRALPNIPDVTPAPTVYPFGGSAPYDELAVDRALPNLPEQAAQRSQVAASGNVRSDVELSTQEGAAESPWANDVHFIAPPL
jgi:hypothetical protein